MTAPDWFLRELKLIDEKYFCFWDDKKNRWMIRNWKERVDIGKEKNLTYKEILQRSNLVLKVAKYDEEGIRELGYMPLDQRALTILKRRKWLSNMPSEKLIKLLDDANAKMQEKKDAETEELIRDAMTIAYNASTRIWW